MCSSQIANSFPYGCSSNKKILFYILEMGGKIKLNQKCQESTTNLSFCQNDPPPSIFLHPQHDITLV